MDDKTKIMSGWTRVNNGSVELFHLSTASLVKLKITSYPDGYDHPPVEVEYFFEYSEFDDLCRCISELTPQFNYPDGGVRYVDPQPLHRLRRLDDDPLPAPTDFVAPGKSKKP